MRLHVRDADAPVGEGEKEDWAEKVHALFSELETASALAGESRKRKGGRSGPLQPQRKSARDHLKALDHALLLMCGVGVRAFLTPALRDG